MSRAPRQLECNEPGIEEDLESVVSESLKLLRPGGTIGFVVASSAYAGMVIPTDEITAQIFERNGLRLRDFVILRGTPGNGNHQSRSTASLRESMVVAERV